MTKNQQAQVTWRDGAVPVSTQFNDPYFSADNGVAETQHVFLGGNGLPDRFCDGFHIAELGFGTGLNFLVTLRAWLDAGQQGRFHFTSFEAYPMAPADMARALQAFPDVAGIAAPLSAAWAEGRRVIETDNYTLTVIEGDARRTLPDWPGQVDAWFLDGFAPASNPELWEASLLAKVAAHLKPGGTCATYTAAGFVRRGLAAAGLSVARVPGYGRKRHMTVASKPEAPA